jgi:uncharacterized protein YndB with AHSA1/START domain
MPKNKDLKRLVRSRMSKTHESYTTARVQLLKKKVPSKAESETDLAALAGMSDDAVRAKTGRSWREWVRVLDAIDATAMPHRDIAKHVYEKHGVPGWWAQTVTVGYERIRGLREVGQRRGGGYEANASKTLPIPISKLYRAFSTPRSRSRWLPGAKLTVRRATSDKSIRITWGDGTSVEATFTAKGSEKSQVAIQHRKLPAKADAARMKAYWRERLDALASLVVPSRSRPG